MGNLLNTIYLIVEIMCTIGSIIGTIILYNKNKYKLIGLKDKVVNGWGLYKVKLKKYENEFILSPYSDEEYLYYYANLNYEEKFFRPINKKKVDIKIYNKNKEKEYHNKFYMILSNKEFLLDSQNIKISLESKINNNIDIELDENQTLLFLEEKFLKEEQEYYALVELKDKKIVLDTIQISDKKENFKQNFLFEISLVWFPTIIFGLTLLFVVK